MQQRVELEVDLGLACRADLVVRGLDLDAEVLQDGGHLAAQVGVVVIRRHREVTLLVPHLVAEVAALLLATGVPRGRLGVDVVVALVGVVVVADRVEDVELRLRPEERSVGDA